LVAPGQRSSRALRPPGPSRAFFPAIPLNSTLAAQPGPPPLSRRSCLFVPGRRRSSRPPRRCEPGPDCRVCCLLTSARGRLVRINPPIGRPRATFISPVPRVRSGRPQSPTASTAPPAGRPHLRLFRADFGPAERTGTPGPALPRPTGRTCRQIWHLTLGAAPKTDGSIMNTRGSTAQRRWTCADSGRPPRLARGWRRRLPIAVTPSRSSCTAGVHVCRVLRGLCTRVKRPGHISWPANARSGVGRWASTSPSRSDPARAGRSPLPRGPAFAGTPQTNVPAAAIPVIPPVVVPPARPAGTRARHRSPVSLPAPVARPRRRPTDVTNARHRCRGSGGFFLA